MSHNAANPSHGGGARGENDLSALSRQYSSQDMPSHTKLKYREKGQSSKADLSRKDLRVELYDREQKAGVTAAWTERKRKSLSSLESQHHLMALAALDKDDPVTDSSSDSDDDDEGTSASNGGSSRKQANKRRRKNRFSSADKTSNVSQKASKKDIPDDSSDDDDEDDETAELYAELNRIKKERAEEELEDDSRRKQEDEKIRRENILRGNPLFNHLLGAGDEKTQPDFNVHRKWNDDVVFKNCAKSDADRRLPGFINDSLRSNFHRKFMDKYIK